MKRYLTVLMALFSVGIAYGQGEGFEVGLKAGVNNTWIVINNDLKNNDHHNENFMVKPAAGISLGYKFNDHTSLMVEGFWAAQGANFKLLDDNGNTIGEKKMKLDYLIVPVLIKMSGQGTTRFVLQVGGQVGFLLKGTEENTYDKDVTINNTYLGPGASLSFKQGTYTIATTDDSKKSATVGSFNKQDWGLVADIGMEHDFSDKCYLSAGLRLAYSFRDIRTGGSQVSLYDIDKYQARYNVVGGIHVGIHWFLSEQ